MSETRGDYAAGPAAMSAEEAERALAELEVLARDKPGYWMGCGRSVDVYAWPADFDHALDYCVTIGKRGTQHIPVSRAEALAWLRGEGVTCRCCGGTGRVRRAE